VSADTILTWSAAAWWGIAGAAALFFLDAPFRTFGQKFLVRRGRERLVMLSFELDLIALWVVATCFLHWRWPLAPPAAAGALAIAGRGLTLAGAALAVWSKLSLGRWFSATFGVKEGHELRTDGPYAFTRHPIYTGLLAMLAGGALVHDSALTLLLAVLMAVPFFFHTVYEEALFEQHFGPAYFEYQRRVPRLLPWPRPNATGRRP
jgi:protein-S-isoprenylcysteine O-methyltransferase Ste14